MTVAGRTRRVRCRACRKKTLHVAVVRETRPEEVKRTRVLGRWILGIGLASGVLSIVFLRKPLERLMAPTLAAMVAVWAGFLVLILLRALILGERGQMLQAWGEYFEWECEACGSVRRGP